MLDFNHNKKFYEKANSFIDFGLENENRKQKPRDYLGGSRLGEACKRMLQYEYFHVPKDPGEDFNGRTLRIFAVGHTFEDLAIKWLRLAAFELVTEYKDGEQYGFSTAEGRIKGHADGIIKNAPEKLKMTFPALWECKTMKASVWKDTVKRGVILAKPVYAAQMAIYQAYLSSIVPDLWKNPALFTAINKDTEELYHELVPFDAVLAQRTSDKGVEILRACDAHELLPRVATNPGDKECKYCPYRKRCWEGDV